MPVGDVYEIKIFCKDQDQVSVNVRHWIKELELGGAVSDLGVAAAVSTALAPPYKGLISVQTGYLGVTAQRISPTPAGFPVVSTAGAGPGEFVGDTLPRQSSGLLSLRSAFAGRAGRGRLYVPFPSEEANDQFARPTAAYLAALGGLRLALLDPIEVIEGANNNRFRPAIWRRASATAIEVVDILIRERWATQRRRSDFAASNPAPF